MVKTVRKVGNGHAIPLDKGVMELLRLHTGSHVQLTVSPERLIVTPVNPGLSERQVSKSLSKFRKRYGKALAELAK